MNALRKLRNRFERFCYRNRDKGIPNLMLYITIGTAIVYILSMMDNSYTLYYALCFDRALILKGQVWRLFTYVFTYNTGNVLFMLVTLFCYYSLGRAMEMSWGTCRFTLFYTVGVVLMDVFCMIFGGTANAYYLNLSLLLGYATLYPNARFLLFFIIPVSAWILALVDLALTLFDVVSLTAAGYFPYSLFPLVAIANYFLFFGKDVVNVIPLSWRMKLGRAARKKPVRKTGAVPFPGAGSSAASRGQDKVPYTHKCTVCGRTDVTNPELEFRYCSKCNGYYCYCEDHINNHAHIQ